MKTFIFSLLFSLLFFNGFSQNNPLAAFEDPETKAYSLLNQADDLFKNQQFDQAILKASQAIDLHINKYSGTAYLIRAKAQFSMDLGKTQVHANQIIEDCTNYLRFGPQNQEGLAYQVRGWMKAILNQQDPSACKDFIEGKLADGKPALLKDWFNFYCTDMEKSMQAFFNVQFTDGTFNNANVTFMLNNINQKIYLRKIINSVDNKAIILAIDYPNKTVWFANLPLNNNGVFPLRKLNLSEFEGNYLGIVLLVDNGHTTKNLGVFIDFKNQKEITGDEFKQIQQSENDRPDNFSYLFVLRPDGKIEIN